jgi:rhodanese-related sulfurtransferase
MSWLQELQAAHLADDQPIVIYCASGHRDGIGILALRMLGWTEVRNLGGGVSAWTAAELPLVK